MPVPTLRRPGTALLLTAALATASATTALALLSGTSGAAERAVGGQSASARLVRLDVSPVAPLGTTAFQGTYGTADSPDIGTEDPGSFTDPDGVLTYITLTGSKVTRTSNTTAEVYAQAQSSGMTLSLQGGSSFIDISRTSGSVSSLDTFAECVPEPVGLFAFAYARTAGAEIEVLGQQVPVGTTTLQVTGADLHHPATLGDSTLTVTYLPHQDPPGGAPTAGVGTAHAWVDITVTGVLNDTTGTQVYSGDIVHLRLGDVYANCAQQIQTTPPPTTEPPTTEPPTTEPPTTAPPTTVPPTTAPPTTAPPTSPTDSASSTGSPPPSLSPSRTSSGTGPGTRTGGGSPGAGGNLAGTGSDDPGPFAGIAMALAALGVTVLTLVHLHRRPRRH